jgi:hypothetical protein
VSSSCWVIVAYNVAVQAPEVLITLTGPAHESLCSILMLAKNALAMHFTLLLMAMSVVKYLYVFVLKSPAGIRDDFWCQSYIQFPDPGS